MAPKRNYTKEQMAKAFEEVKRGENLSVAASKYNVPRITLRNKVMGISPIDCNLGPATVLSVEEEKLLVTWILFMAEHHFPITRDHLLDSVQKIVMDKELDKCPFTNNRPGKKWYASFLKRHPELSERTAQNLTKARDEVTEEELNDWFKVNKEYFQSKDLSAALNDPTRIFNCDESAFFLQPKVGRVLVHKGDKNIYSAAGDEKENLTVLVTANAAGTLAPPMIVYPYERIPKHVGDKIPGSFAIGKSDSGWMTAKTFFEYIANIFNPWLDKNKIQKPVLLFVDGHRSHMSMHLSELCKDKGIELIALYPNSTHLLQPMDVAVFRPLKVFWKKQVATWKFENPRQRLNKENFAPNFEAALGKISTEVIKNGFRKSGLYPFGPENIDMGKLRTQNRDNTPTKVIKENLELAEKTNFINVLEKEIEQVFSSEKLNLFKQKFNLPGDEVEKMLAPEDESLFVIWAKNKNLVAGTATIPEDISAQARQPEFLQKDSDTITASPEASSLTEEYPQSSVEGTANIPGNISAQPTQPEFLQEDPVSDAGFVPPKESSLTDEYPQSREEGTPNTPGKIFAQPKQPELLQEDPVSDVDSASRAPNNSVDFLAVTHGVPNSHVNYTPQKTAKSVIMPVGIEIPSPFKRALLWPEPDTKKRRTKEQFPSAITGEAWRAIMAKKEAEKKQKEEEKELRKKKREENKIQKEKIIEERKKMKKNDKTKTQSKSKPKKKQTPTSSTDESDTDIDYGDSEYDAQDDLEEEEDCEFNRRPELKENNKGRIRKRNVASESDSEEDNLSLRQKVTKNPKKDNYVIINYEGEYFPGVVKNIDGKQYEISTMTLSKGNSFRWPENPDQIWYNQEAIVENIGNPVLINKRGFYKVKEMEKYLPFVSL